MVTTVLCLVWLLASGATAFAPMQGMNHIRPIASKISKPRTLPTVGPPSQPADRCTSLHAIVDVPPHFFAITMPSLWIIGNWVKNLARARLEELAWEQRLEEARERRLSEDPTVTELDLRRQEAAMEWSAYGDSARQERRQMDEAAVSSRREQRRQRGGRLTQVLEREEPSPAPRAKTREQISQFEKANGVLYDPYYDDPYTEDELPDDVGFRVDKKYGDRVYDNGEMFFKDKETGLFYRQGAKPKGLSFLGWNAWST